MWMLGAFSIGLWACDGSTAGTGRAAQEVVLDVRCNADADCPGGFECESETEHGVSTSFCVSHDEDAAQAGDCPSGFELEEEHDGTFCKAHGGDDGTGGHHGGGNDDGGNGSATEGQACSTDADCGGGLECEIEQQGGVSTSTCQPHGGGN